MDLEKAYDRVDWLVLWEVLKIYGVGEKLLSAIKSFYEAASACVEINGETSEHFEIKVGFRQRCVRRSSACMYHTLVEAFNSCEHQVKRKMKEMRPNPTGCSSCSKMH